MSGLLALMLAAHALATGDAWEPRDVVSPNGFFRAELRLAPGYEGRPPELSRWRLRVVFESEVERELWSCPYPYDGSAEHYRLTDDGRTFAHVKSAFSEHRPVVVVFRDGREAGQVTGSAFALGRASTPRTEAGRRWLAEEGVPTVPRVLETSLGPVPLFELECLGDERRWLDPVGARVWWDADFDELFRVRVEPELPDRLARLVTLPYVEAAHAGTWLRAGTPVRVTLTADAPTPGCRFEGFALEQTGHEGRELRLRPTLREPVGSAVPQVLTRFQPTALLHGLVPGTYSVEVVGRVPVARAPLDLRVLPADTRCVLRTWSAGGSAYEERLLLGRGAVRRRAASTRTDRSLPPSQLERLEQLVSELPTRASASRGLRAVSDRIELVHWPEGEPVVLERAPSDLTGALAELNQALGAID